MTVLPMLKPGSNNPLPKRCGNSIPRRFLKSPFPKQRSVLIFVLVLIAVIARADPENFMVGKFTFVRPAKWNWVWDEKLSDKGLFLEIPAPETNDTAAVYFRAFTGADGAAQKRTKVWQACFKESPENLKLRSESKYVASFTVAYIEMEGTWLRDSRPGFSLFGAVINTKEGHVVVRMSGPKKVIDNAKPVFTEMVERALKEKQPD